MIRLALLALLLLPACAPWTIAARPIPEPPVIEEAPHLIRPTIHPTDCPRLLLEGGVWTRQPWDVDDLQDGQLIDSLQPGDPSPVAPLGVVECRHVVIPPSLWALGREAIRRYPEARLQADAWRAYSLELSMGWSSESAALADAGRQARMGQLRAALAGAGAGAASVVAILLASLLAGR